MNLLELCLGQLPEAIYFSLFILLSKQVKNKKLIFVIINIIEYLLLLNIFPFSTKAHIVYFVLFYLELKVLYKDQTQITDVFTLGIASILMMIVNLVLYPIALCLHNYLLYAITTRIVLFLILFLIRNKLFLIQRIYFKFWNRNDKIKRIMKSTTFRSLNLVIFNLMFYIINICMIYSLVRRC